MLDDVIRAPRTDAIYNMHGYLTKVPVGAIIPFILEYTPDDGLVVDMFAGSGMTALAAKMTGRSAVASDISKLGQHICQGYMAEVSHEKFHEAAEGIVAESKSTIGRLYNTIRSSDGEVVESIRTVWSFIYACGSCEKPISYYRALKAASWHSDAISCRHCAAPFVKKGAKFLGEKPEIVVVKESRQVEQNVAEVDLENISKAEGLDFLSKIPSQNISESREMYKRSALAKWNLTETRLFFSQRNSAVLYDLWEKINGIENPAIKKKLRFCFTAILPRASKRYQWSIKAPLNAVNQNYYIAPVFYEWNVYDLFMRKVEAAKRADNLLFGITDLGTQKYATASADNLKHLDNESVDFVFTDPPFGSNIFYADMNLFQEAWLGKTTNDKREAVIRTTVDKAEKEKSKSFYKELLKNAFSEAYRVLKAGGHISIVFGNSKGGIWALAQEAIVEAGFVDKPVAINILDKGQRSVKGLNSGTENVATLDLIVTLKKPTDPDAHEGFSIVSEEVVNSTLDQLGNIEGLTPSHVYLEVLKNAFYKHINVAQVDLAQILELIEEKGFRLDSNTGKLGPVNNSV